MSFDIEKIKSLITVAAQAQVDELELSHSGLDIRVQRYVEVLRAGVMNPNWGPRLLLLLCIVWSRQNPRVQKRVFTFSRRRWPAPSIAPSTLTLVRW